MQIYYIHVLLFLVSSFCLKIWACRFYLWKIWMANFWKKHPTVKESTYVHDLSWDRRKTRERCKFLKPFFVFQVIYPSFFPILVTASLQFFHWLCAQIFSLISWKIFREHECLEGQCNQFWLFALNLESKIYKFDNGGHFFRRRYIEST